MNKKNKLFGLVFLMMLVFISYIVYMYVFRDPDATAFLSHKPDDRSPDRMNAWLGVMRVHAILASMAMIAGLINFIPAVWRKFRLWHRVSGYLYLSCVAVVVLTSGYMAP
ncbi:DUF2306 domain-containing protein [Paenibacillus sp. J5C_2022]|uniref:DUF2306 domain-containing protein n=1 Tax=Paenibacillus sp. J5C2022 TaxID=2977129 RepID=UPI0021D22895|nr:DUF2306 domain-containing protein [Paenibacillus sp. J5C2022]MCU6712201.1 DUF2306 domain-containing protein [Paenibacillus sp. J5C2022]